MYSYTTDVKARTKQVSLLRNSLKESNDYYLT